jgi:hypothetical protein
MAHKGFSAPVGLIGAAVAAHGAPAQRASPAVPTWNQVFDWLQQFDTLRNALAA